MHHALKIFFLAACILVAAFFANFFGFVSIPWLDVDMGPTYGSEAQKSEEVVKKVFEEEKTDYSE
jgi:hypothetical protein